MSAAELMRWLLAQLAPYGVRATITSGTRTYQQQAALYSQPNRRYPVAPPGSSRHEQGRAVDVSASPEVLRLLAHYWRGWGGVWGGDWRQPDPVHYEF